MTDVSVPPRSAIAREHTWNRESVFESDAAWAAEAASLPEAIAALDQHRGRLAEGPGRLREALEAVEAVMRRVGKMYVYASMDRAVDTTNQDANRRYGQAEGLIGQALGSIGFVQPELLAIGRAQLDEWLKAEPRLASYAHFLDDLFRRQAHVRSAEVEQIMGMLADPFGGTQTTASMLTDADFKFRPARTSQGAEVPVTHGNYETLRASPDREVRRTAWESYTDTFLAFRNTLASNLATSIRQNTFGMRVRQYPSTLEASLFANNVPVEVFHNFLDTFRRNLATWHRYWAVRRKALGVDRLHPYDIWAPLTTERPRVDYPQAVEWIAGALAPLGSDYVDTLRRGTLQDRWVDIYPNQGKTEGAFSSGWPGTFPFILMSYDNTLFTLGTLTHELGHSMHSYLTWQTQPYVYSDYSLFVAEVASNFHQAMTRAYLLQHNPARDFQITVLEEAMDNFHRYLFIMPTLARFELEAHQRAERGQGLTADDLNALMADLFEEGYGGQMEVDHDRVGITWATFPHLYADYYVYQYATGISAANALARRIVAGQPGAAEAYVRFLKAGASVYPLEALQIAGVDMRQPEAVDEAFAVLAGYVDRLEQLSG